MESIEEQIFADAIALTMQQREAYLDQQCQGDQQLRSRMENLLAAHEEQGGILDVQETCLQPNGVNEISAGQDIGNYRLLQKIGEGGFGIVFMAEQRKPVVRKVAVKVIKPGMDSRAVVARFEGERQALAMMDHPNIARVFDGGTNKAGMPYFVMELVQGVPITEFCDANSFTTKERLELFITVCHAVHHAHQKGIIHRDIKPNNVMVTLHDGKPVVKVIDFGVAKALHQKLTDKTLFTQYGMMVGTPQYMSPEQAEMTGLDVDTRSDVYSLAVLLFELMTGSTPIRTEDLKTAGIKEMQRMICEDRAIRPSLRISSAGNKLTVLANHRRVLPNKLSKEIQGDLDWIVLKGLEKERTRRYDSASVLAADVGRALRNEPVLAGPPSLYYRAKKFTIRQRVRIALAASLLAVLSTIVLGLVNHRNQRLATIAKDTSRLNIAIDESNSALVAAVQAGTSNDLWKTADLSAKRLRQILDNCLAEKSSANRARQFLVAYDLARQDREFTFSMEELLINHSTDQTLKNLQFMESEFRKILLNRGFDLGQSNFDQIGNKLKKDRSPLKVTDALELWLMIRIKLANEGGQKISNDEIKNWIIALSVGDPNPMRTAIRKTIFKTVASDRKFLNEIIKQEDILNACARKLSWLADAYDLVGLPDQASKTREFALTQHAGDLLLNFEHAADLMGQGKPEAAVPYLMRCTSIRPENAGVWKELANAFGQINELPKAQNAINKAIDLNPMDAGSHLSSAELLLKAGAPSAAVAEAEIAKKINPKLAAVWSVIGRAKINMQDYAGAISALGKFKEMAVSADAAIDEWIKKCEHELIETETN